MEWMAFWTIMHLVGCSPDQDDYGRDQFTQNTIVCSKEIKHVRSFDTLVEALNFKEKGKADCDGCYDWRIERR